MRTVLFPWLVAALATACALAMPATASSGAWAPIPAIGDPAVQDLGLWAVAEHVKQVNDGLKFQKVVSGEDQYILQTRLVIDALNRDGKDGEYQAVVYVQDNTRKLVSFAPTN